VRLDEFNAQLQPQLTWAPSFAVVGSYYDQAVRSGQLTGDVAVEIQTAIDKAEQFVDGPQHTAGLAQLENAARAADRLGLVTLSGALDELQESLR
jgi:hypothetical protein